MAVRQADGESDQRQVLENGRKKACGTAAMGSPPSWISKVRRRVAQAARCRGRGRCLTTAFSLMHPDADLAVTIPRNLLRQQLLFWERNPRLRPFGRVWGQIATAVARQPNIRWWYVRGADVRSHCGFAPTPVDHHSSHVVERTRRLQVELFMQGEWVSTTGAVGRHSATQSTWSYGREQSDTKLGAGVAGGVDFSAPVKHDRFLAKKGLVETPVCPCCGDEAEDTYYRVWTCSANAGEVFDRTASRPSCNARQAHCGVFLAARAGLPVRGLNPTQNQRQGDKLVRRLGDGSGTHSDLRQRRVGLAAIVQGMAPVLGHSQRIAAGLTPQVDSQERLAKANRTLWTVREHQRQCGLCHGLRDHREA